MILHCESLWWTINSTFKLLSLICHFKAISFLEYILQSSNLKDARASPASGKVIGTPTTLFMLKKGKNKIQGGKVGKYSWDK